MKCIDFCPDNRMRYCDKVLLKITIYWNDYFDIKTLHCSAYHDRERLSFWAHDLEHEVWLVYHELTFLQPSRNEVITPNFVEF